MLARFVFVSHSDGRRGGTKIALRSFPAALNLGKITWCYNGALTLVWFAFLPAVAVQGRRRRKNRDSLS